MPSSATNEKIPFRIHPRVFAALGEDLVTSDVVAALELVKNSYDAMATHVEVNFVNRPQSDSVWKLRTTV